MVCDIEWSSPTVERILKTLIVLGLLEVAEYVMITPPKVAELPPVIIIVSMPADVDHVVDGA